MFELGQRVGIIKDGVDVTNDPNVRTYYERGETYIYIYP